MMAFMKGRQPYDAHAAFQQAKRSTSSADATAAWEILLKTLEEHDMAMIDAWKDELNNLLIFAGLFSAVVTAFTVESYSWLQQDPTDTSTQLLAQISLQLSSLSIGVGYINSTAPPLKPQNAQAGFTPTAVAVNVNILWVLSLTFSLLASFFAIAVQQWLRHLPLPSRISLREAIRLQQYRYEGLQRWQVAGIVSLLPLLLQIAVIVFLAGLLLLLSSLNCSVALVFAVAAGVGVLVFLVTASIPLISVRCPYKSPLIPTALAALQWSTYPVTLVACALGLAVDVLFRIKMVEDMLFRYGYWITYRNVFHRRLSSLQKYVREFGMHMYIDVNHFWTNREVDVLLKSDADSLDSGALARGIVSARSDTFSVIEKCLQDLPDVSRIACIRDAVCGPPVRLEENAIVSVVLGRSVPTALAHSGRLLSARHEELIVASLPRTLVGFDAFCVRHDVAHLLVVLRFAMRAHDVASPKRRFYAHLLFNLRARQELESRSWWWTGRQILTTLLFEECTHYAFTRDEARLAMSWAQELLSLGNRPDAEWVFKYSWLHAAGTVLASAATALTALAAQESLDSEDTFQLTRVLRALKHFLHKYKTVVVSCADQCRADPEASILVVGPRAVVAICKSLASVALTEADWQLVEERCSLRELEALLAEICNGREEDILVEARRHLRRLRRRCSSSGARAVVATRDVQCAQDCEISALLRPGN